MDDSSLSAAKRELVEHAYRLYHNALTIMLADTDYTLPERQLDRVAEERVRWSEDDVPPSDQG
jgi:hypothetical protein